jgi:hypothetical protein
MASKTTSATFELPASVYSPELLESVRYEIDRYLNWHRQNAIQTKVGASPIPEPDHSAETAQVIEAWLAGKPATISGLEALVKHLETLDLPVVHLTLAALPNRAQRGQLVDWFRGVVGPHVLISFIGDRNLGGGILVRTPNRVFDLSWKQRLVDGRANIAAVVRRV